MAWRDDLILPDQPVHLAAGQVEELARRLAGLGQEILGYVALLEALLQSGSSSGSLAAARTPGRPLPAEVVLSARQIESLYDCLATVRHDINGQGAVVVAVIELLRLKPGEKDRLLAKMATVPGVIAGKLAQFSAAFEEALGVSPLPLSPRSAELPRDADELARALAEQPAHIRERIRLFSDHFERVLQIRRKSPPPQNAAPGC